MAQVWDADVTLSQADAMALLASQCPQVGSIERVSLLGVGWDNWAYLVNDTWVVRFPRREMAVDFLRTESTWLPRLREHVPLAVPLPELRGEPTSGYPYPFAGYRVIPGRTACGVPWDATQQLAAAAPLAQFLRALHSAKPQADGEAVPGDTIRRAILPPRADQTSERLDKLTDHLDPIDAIRDAVYALSTTPDFEGTPCWVHGDFYPRHLLVDDHAMPCAAIDWGDLHVGDPALDLMAAYLLFDQPARTRFLEAYGAIPDATRDRARFRALYYGAALLLYGLDINDADLQRVGHDAFRRAMPAE